MQFSEPDPTHGGLRRQTISLETLGWNSARWAQFAPFRADYVSPGRVSRVDGATCLVITGQGIVRAGFDPSLDLKPVVGDWAVVLLRDRANAFLRAVLPRTSQLARADARTEEVSATTVQLMAANIELAVVMQAANDLNIRRLEREVAIAVSSGARLVVLVTKVDLVADSKHLIDQVVERLPGITPFCVSGRTGDGVDRFAQLLGPGITAALIGASGVGKSTLINCLLGEDIQGVREVRDSDARGRHTTTARTLLPLPVGGAIVDMPGIRSVGVTEASEALDTLFPEVVEAAQECRFRNCQHRTEPGCAVRNAVTSGEIDPQELDSYSRLEREARWFQSKTDLRLQSERRKKWKDIAKSQRVRERLDG